MCGKLDGAGWSWIGWIKLDRLDSRIGWISGYWMLDTRCRLS